MYAQDSIDLLRNSGIQFKKHEEDGINPVEFATLLTTSGVVLFDNIVWLSFHAGYDFGYLLKILTCQPLPRDESEFFEILKIFFPNIYDVKVPLAVCRSRKRDYQQRSFSSSSPS
jgi:CCR4-NOT transcription complex subunit 7/8